MKLNSKFVNMIIAFVVLGLSVIAFFVLLINYEVKKPELPTPTPITTPTTTPTNTPLPTPTPGYTKSQWNKVFVLDDPTYVYTETVTDSEGNALKNIYKIADGSLYIFNQTSNKAAKETWNLILEEKCVTVTGTLALNSEGAFEVNKSGYKSKDIDKDTLTASNNDYIKKVKELLEKYKDEISYKSYDCIEVFKLYKTKEDSEVSVTISIEEDKLKSMEIEFVDSTDPEKPKTINYLIEINAFAKEELLDSNPKK